MKYKAWLALVPLLLMNGCARPVVVTPVSVTDNEMSCEQIMSEIKEAERYRQEARAEDKFKWQYMLIAPAAVSVHNMHKAEKAAIERKEGLEQLAKRKDCTEKK